jgi:hypothetical protein
MNRGPNFKTLGLSADASWDEVKSAFRRLARLYHPDVAGADSARKFAEITEAYMTLKDSISPGASTRRKTHRYDPASGRPSPRQPVKEAPQRDSIFKAFWRKLFSSTKRESHDAESFDYDLPPARVRFIGSVISRAEFEMHTLLLRRGEIKARGRTDSILRRLRSKHPSVVMLALQSITRHDVTDEMRRSVVEHFGKSAPATEILESLLALFSSSERAIDMARALASHAGGYSNADSLMIIRWFKRQNAPKECYASFLSHPQNSVVAAVLMGWPSGQSLPESLDLMSLLKKDDESILVPLLRLMKKEKTPVWLIPTITKIMTGHKSPAVRVWASTIVRDQNLS